MKSDDRFFSLCDSKNRDGSSHKSVEGSEVIVKSELVFLFSSSFFVLISGTYDAEASWLNFDLGGTA